VVATRAKNKTNRKQLTQIFRLSSESINNTNHLITYLIMSKEGVVVSMFPPTNDGTRRGAGIVRENDGTNNGAEFVFQTPQDVSDTPLELNTKITFEAEGNDARNVKKATVAEPNIR